MIIKPFQNTVYFVYTCTGLHFFDFFLFNIFFYDVSSGVSLPARSTALPSRATDRATDTPLANTKIQRYGQGYGHASCKQKNKRY